MLCDKRVIFLDIIRIFPIRKSKSNKSFHMVFCSINLMVIKMSIHYVSCVVCFCDRACIAFAIENCIRAKMACVWFGFVLSFFAWIQMHRIRTISAKFHFSSGVFIISMCRHIDIATREKAIARLDNNSMQCNAWCVHDGDVYLPTYPITKAHDMTATTTTTGSNCTVAAAAANENWFSVCV